MDDDSAPAEDQDDPVDEAEIRMQIAVLRQEHEDLDAAITALAERHDVDQLRIARLKKRKLMLRDQIIVLEDRLTPDIIA
jgi:hypothetical protein